MIKMKWSTQPTTEATAAASASAYLAIRQRRNDFPPINSTTSSSCTAASHFPRASSYSPSCRRHNFLSVTSIIFWFWAIVLVFWCSPLVNGLPLVMMTATSPYSVRDDVILNFRGGYVAPQRWLHWPHHHDNSNNVLDRLPMKQMVAGDDEDEEDVGSVQNWNYGDSEQEATGLISPSESMERMTRMGMPPRKKKGLSYLTKYYSDAFSNNNSPPNGSGGGGGGGNSAAGSSVQSHHDSGNHFFGVSGGNGGSSASGEQRFPSSVRRKLSFYPPLTSNSVFMSPWSRSGTGFASGSRNPTMRLRWGK